MKFIKKNTYASQAIQVMALLFVAIAWGFIPMSQKILLSKLSPTQVVFSRFFLSSLCFLCIVLFMDSRAFLLAIKQHLITIFFFTLFGPLVGMTLINYGLKSVPVSIAGVISSFELVFVYVFAVLAGQESWSSKRMLSVFIAASGVVLIIYTKVAINSTPLVFWLGLLSIIGANIVLALNTIISKKLAPNCSPFVFMAISFLLGSLCMVPFIGVNYLSILQNINSELWGALLFCVLIGTVFSFSVWYYALKTISPTAVSTVMCLVPVIAFISGVVFLKEHNSFLKMLGLIVVLVGLYLVNVVYKK